jgi:hypothetical protein
LGIHKYHELLSEEGNNGEADPAIEHLDMGLGDDRETSVTVEPGGTISLDVEVRARESIRELTVGFNVHDERGQELYEVRCEEVGAAAVELERGGVFRTRFRFSANLLPGIYWIGVSIRGRTQRSENSEPDCLAYLPNRLQLDVRGDAEGRGSVHLFTACESDCVPACSASTAMEVS